MYLTRKYPPPPKRFSMKYGQKSPMQKAAAPSMAFIYRNILQLFVYLICSISLFFHHLLLLVMCTSGKTNFSTGQESSCFSRLRMVYIMPDHVIAVLHHLLTRIAKKPRRCLSLVLPAFFGCNWLL